MSSLTHKRIAVLKGGPGSERQISLASAAGVAGALRELGAEVIEVDVTSPHFELPEGIDLAFNMNHGTLGEDGQLQRALEARGIPCAPVQNVAEMLDHEQTRALGIYQPVPGSSRPLMGLPISFDGRRPQPRSAAPALGADTAAILGACCE